jgi:uncharacterized protein
MRITVHVKPGAREECIEKVDERTYRVWVKAQPKDGKANSALVELLAEYFETSKSTVEIISGQGGRHKIVEIHL